MRANAPVDDDFNVIQPPEEGTPVEKVTQEQKDLAKIGNSPQWKIISEYLDARIEVYKNGLFGEELGGADAATIGNRFLAARSVVSEFESLKYQVETTTQSVNESVENPTGQ